MAPICFIPTELAVENCFPGGIAPSEHPGYLFWTVEAFVTTSHFSRLRRDETEHAIADPFIDALGNDGLVGQNIDRVKISKLIGATERPERLEGELELGARR